MAFLTFRICDQTYNLNDVTNELFDHDALIPLSGASKLYTLVRVEQCEEQKGTFVAYIVGDVCNLHNIGQLHFVSFDDNISSSADKIAVSFAINYLNKNIIIR